MSRINATLHQRGKKLTASLLLLALLLAGCVTRVAPRPPDVASRVGTMSAREASNLRVFDAVWDLVNRKFYDPKFRGVDWPALALSYGPKAVAATDDEQLYEALNAMLGELKESHNAASSPKAREERMDRPKFRLGISIARVEHRWLILDVLPGSPADEAGIKRGWIFVSRNGRRLGPGEIFELKEGQTVTDVYRDQFELLHEFTMTARPLQARAWREARELEGGVRYLRFDGFDRASRRWLSEQLKSPREAPALMIDLRQNGGGSTFSLGVTVGEFFTRKVGWGRLLGRKGEAYEVDSWQWGSAHYGGKIAILVDGGTASSAEIFARVLQFRQRAVIVGRKTAGAVIASRMFKLPDGGELQLGVFNYEGPDDHRLEGVGVTPDLLVPSAYESVLGFRGGRDLDIEAALEALRARST